MQNSEDFDISGLQSDKQKDDLLDHMMHVAHGLFIYANKTLDKGLEGTLSSDDAKAFHDVSLGVASALAACQGLAHRCSRE
jgi:hypothetical protein